MDDNVVRYLFDDHYHSLIYEIFKKKKTFNRDKTIENDHNHLNNSYQFIHCKLKNKL